MSIIQIDSDSVLHCCDACGFEREVAFDLIEVGVVPDAEGRIDIDGVDRADPLVALPSCNKCGSVDLIRLPTTDTPIERRDELALMWERLGGEPIDLSVPLAEPSTEDVSADDFSFDN